MTTSSTSTCAPGVKLDGRPLHLWQQLAPEDGNLNSKECFADEPVHCAMEDLEDLEDYGATWLNDSTGGVLLIGVSDMPLLAVGVWLDKEAVLFLTQGLVKWFKGSL